MKLIIDTDPGVDDAMAIIAAFNIPEVEVIGLTTIYGNVPTKLATTNALRLLKLLGKQVPVAEGSHTTLSGESKVHVADFVHGVDGFGNINLPVAEGEAIAASAAQFIVDMVHLHGEDVSILALGPVTNIALAVKLDPTITDKWGQLLILGGAFFVNGNVSPAAEANIYNDVDAADFVLAQTGKIKILGLDVTHQCRLSKTLLDGLASAGPLGTFVARISAFYYQYHADYYHIDAIHVHDPTALVALVRPDLFKWHTGAVRVAVDGTHKGSTIMDFGGRKWYGMNDWSGRPPIQVALSADKDAVVGLVVELLSKG